MVHHLTTIKTLAQSPVNRLNGYSIPTALGFASGVSGYSGRPEIYSIDSKSV